MDYHSVHHLVPNTLFFHIPQEPATKEWTGDRKGNATTPFNTITPGTAYDSLSRAHRGPICHAMLASHQVLTAPPAEMSTGCYKMMNHRSPHREGRPEGKHHHTPQCHHNWNSN
jgi:hypothetical protein